MDNNTENSNNTESRFIMNREDINFKNNTGDIITDKDYFKKRRVVNTTYTNKLNIGDIVKIKNIDRTLVTKYIDFQINDNMKSDYAGTLYNSDSEELFLFGQDDIEIVLGNE